jgi:hypothetical protein
MPFTVICPSCKKTYKVEDKNTGKTTKCGGCGWRLELYPQVDVVPEFPQSPQDLFQQNAGQTLPPVNMTGAKLEIELGKIETILNTVLLSCSVTPSNEATLILYVSPEDGRKSGTCVFLSEQQFLELKTLISKADEIFRRCQNTR